MTNPRESLIRHQLSHPIDTFRDGDSSGEEAPTNGRPSPGSFSGTKRSTGRQYVAPMAITTANAIATALREHLSTRITYLPDRKLHALLYLALGACFAANNEPLFVNTITATSTGVRVDGLTGSQAEEPLDDEQNAVVRLTAARYGGLSAMDLEALIRGQAPWSTTAAGEAIDPELIRKTVQEQEEIPEGTVSGYPRSVRASMHRPNGSLPATSAAPDSPEEIAAFVADVRARM
jgi:uncharacterized phage-associated protein